MYETKIVRNDTVWIDLSENGQEAVHIELPKDKQEAV